MIPLIIFAAAFGTALLTAPPAMRLAERWSIVAIPGGRRKHHGRLPKLGGVPLLAGILVAAALTYLLLPPNGNDAIRLRGVLIGTIVIFVGGLIDDKYELSPAANFGIQLVAAAVAVGHIVFIELFTNPLNGAQVHITPRWVAILFSLLWLIGMINAVNFLDGLDGLAAGVGIVAALLFAWHSYRWFQQTTVPLFPLALAGALLGFLPFNFAPSRLILGSAGAYVLGYQLATLAILSPAKIATALLVMAVPLLDVAWLVWARWRHGQSPFRGDRRHLHFRLADRGVPTRLIVGGYIAVAAAFGAVGVLPVTPRTKLVLLVLWATAVLALLVGLARSGNRSGGVANE